MLTSNCCCVRSCAPTSHAFGSLLSAAHSPMVQVGAVADPATGERMEKAVFVVFFAGERARQKILKICEVGAGRGLG